MILVSACLLGEDCKYNGENNYSSEVEELLAGEEVVTVCPEKLGGLSTPREPAEIIEGTAEDIWDGEAKVVNKEGEDVTPYFIRGATNTLFRARKNDCELALLKARSPSCGSKEIYNGNFAGTTKPGQGVTAFLLEKKGIKVFNEEEINKLADKLKGEE
jgi:uncharacterized protein YbbK (DUF523 family)